MGRVFVIHVPVRYDPERGGVVPRYDVAPATEFGRLVEVLPSNATIRDAEAAIDRITEVLADFSDSDYLLLIGHPCFIGWAVALAAAANRGKVRALAWSSKRYVVVPAVLPVGKAALSSGTSGAEE